MQSSRDPVRQRGRRSATIEISDLDKEQLEGAPSYRKTDALDWDDPVWAKKVHEYYNVPPFWI